MSKSDPLNRVPSGPGTFAGSASGVPAHRRAVVTAPSTLDPDTLVGPVVFLAGPIQGADDWQDQAIDRLQALTWDIDVHIANPRQKEKVSGELAADRYRDQVAWESRWLLRSRRKGLVLFWCAKENEHRCDRAYAQTTRFELGEHLMMTRVDGAPVVVGIEPGFTGERYLRQRLPEYEPYRGFRVQSSLEDTLVEAAKVLRSFYFPSTAKKPW